MEMPGSGTGLGQAGKRKAAGMTSEKQRSAKLPTPDWRTAFKRLEGAYAATTMRSYASDVGIYTAWCAENGRAALPASVETICAFLEAQAVDCRATTVQRRLSAIRKAHRVLGLPDPTSDEEITLTIRRILRRKLIRPKQAKGLTRPYLEAFLEAQPDGPMGLRNKAMLALGYDLLTRRSELVALRTEDVKLRGDGTLRVLIRRSKADPFGKGRIAFTSRRTAELVMAWLDWRGREIPPLFCPVYQGHAIHRGLSTTAVKRVIKETAARAGLSPEEAGAFSGHSLRVGAAQDLLSAGHDTAAIMRAGGWKSLSSLSRYLEFAEHNVWA